MVALVLDTSCAINSLQKVDPMVVMADGRVTATLEDRAQFAEIGKGEP